MKRTTSALRKTINWIKLCESFPLYWNKTEKLVPTVLNEKFFLQSTFFTISEIVAINNEKI